MLERAKKLINDFCLREYRSPADFSDLTAIDIGYTTVSDVEIPVQATVDLVHFCLDRRLDGTLISRRKYFTLAGLISGELEDLDFNDLIDVCEEQISAIQEDDND